ncbi:MAG TPA: hypothetical protein VFK13_03995 [Gemmatimonadaceae bacterium]|nr:hypothetical protein [Gemmatimonadaceae bacterium]
MMATKWDKDLAKIDKQLAALSDDELLERTRAPEEAPPRGALAGVPGAPPDTARAQAPARAWRTRAGVLLRAGLTVVLAAAVTLWPYGVRCGVPLFAYLTSLAVLLVAGTWAAVWSWRHRAPVAHVLALLAVLWSLALATREVLPRTGHALPTPQHPALWTCG